MTYYACYLWIGSRPVVEGMKRKFVFFPFLSDIQILFLLHATSGACHWWSLPLVEVLFLSVLWWQACYDSSPAWVTVHAMHTRWKRDESARFALVPPRQGDVRRKSCEGESWEWNAREREPSEERLRTNVLLFFFASLGPEIQREEKSSRRFAKWKRSSEKIVNRQESALVSFRELPIGRDETRMSDQLSPVRVKR